MTLPSFKLKARSDVVGTWEIASTTYNHFYCQVKVIVSAHCFNSTVSKSGETHFSQQMEEEDSVATRHIRVLLWPPALSRLTQSASLLLKRDTAHPRVPQRRIMSHNLESSRQMHHCLWELEMARTI